MNASLTMTPQSCSLMVSCPMRSLEVSSSAHLATQDNLKAIFSPSVQSHDQQGHNSQGFSSSWSTPSLRPFTHPGRSPTSWIAYGSPKEKP